MPKIAASDGPQLYVEESGTGMPIVFVHEYAGDYRSWEPQMDHFCRQHRCVTYSQRGYSPSDVPSDPGHYEDDGCLEGSVYIKRTVPSAALLVIPRAGHTINSEEPVAVNAALAELFSAVEAGRRLAYKAAE